MDIIFNKIFLEHDTGMHPENRKRLEKLDKIKEMKIENGEKYLELFHKKAYIKKIKEFCANGGGYLDSDTVVSKKSYEAAIYAVGATVMASESGDFALVRPPGHHAHPSMSSGFCIFNNIGIATQRLVNQGKKVLIFDFDAHLGDGTSKFFYKSDRVLYWSLHQYPAFPGHGSVEEIGEEKGEGFTINVPLDPGSGDDIYMKALELIMPVAKQFKPDAVAVSAGFDGHQSDLLLDLRLSVNTYYKMGKLLGKEFKNVFATLEGGYNIDVFPKCLHNFVDGVNGKKASFKEEPTDSKILTIEGFEARLYELQKRLSKYWDI